MKRCLITGSAAGIGLALARRFGSEGYEVTGIDIKAMHRALPNASQNGKAAASNGAPELPTETIQADLAEASEVERVLELLRSSSRRPFDTVIHNAGINCVGPFQRARWDSQERVIALNLTSPMLLSSGLLRDDLIDPGGTLVFISSLSHFVGYPGAAAYAASKDGITSYAASLQAFLAPRGGHVLTVYPGPTRTEHARRHSPDNTREHKRMPPEELARRIHKALLQRRRVLVPGTGNRIFAALGHLMPRLSEKAMKKTLFDKLQQPENH